MTTINAGACGFNKSAEDGGEQDTNESSQSGCNIVLANRLMEIAYIKKSYQAHIKVFYIYLSLICMCSPFRPDAAQILK